MTTPTTTSASSTLIDAKETKSNRPISSVAEQKGIYKRIRRGLGRQKRPLRRRRRRRRLDRERERDRKDVTSLASISTTCCQLGESVSSRVPACNLISTSLSGRALSALGLYFYSRLAGTVFRALYSGQQQVSGLVVDVGPFHEFAVCVCWSISRIDVGVSANANKQSSQARSLYPNMCDSQLGIALHRLRQLQVSSVFMKDSVTFNGERGAR